MSSDPLLKNVPPGGRPGEDEAERATLGAALIDPGVLDELAWLRPEDFYRPVHALLWRAILELRRAGRPPDVVLLHEHLAARGVLEQVGGAGALTALTEVVPTSANAAYYASIVQRLADLRRVIKAAAELTQWAFEARADVTPSEIERRVGEITRAGSAGRAPAGEHLGALAGAVLERYLRQEVPVVFRTGFPELDDRLGGGVRPGKLTLLAARPSMGKTALLTRMARLVAGEEVPVSLFSLEVDRLSVTTNMLAAETRVSASRIAAGRMTPEEGQRFLAAVETFERLPMQVHEGRRWCLSDLACAVRQDVRRWGTRVVFVDYVQLIEPDAEGRTRAEEVSQISRELKLLALELDVALVAAAQLVRDVEKRRDKWPMLSDLKESGGLEQDADVVMLLHRPEYYDPKEDNKGLALVDVAKQRDGPTGPVDLTFHAECIRFESVERLEPWQRAARERAAAAGAEA